MFEENNLLHELIIMNMACTMLSKYFIIATYKYLRFKSYLLYLSSPFRKLVLNSARL